MSEVININWIKKITGGDAFYMRDLDTKLIAQLTGSGIFVVDKYCCSNANHGAINDINPTKHFLQSNKSKL